MDPDKIRIEKKGLVGKILYGSNTCKISRFLLWCKTCGGYGLRADRNARKDLHLWADHP